jgi:nitrite reductase/ring-hydroxylating ferredoxin subunit
MATFVKVVKVSDVPEGTMKHVVISGKNIALAHIGDEFFAVDDTCTHEQCSLGGEGFLDGNVITCGCHGAQYDVTNGHVLAQPATVDLASYKTKVDSHHVFIEL